MGLDIIAVHPNSVKGYPEKGSYYYTDFVPGDIAGISEDRCFLVAKDIYHDTFLDPEMRGKFENEYVERATGQSLYQEYITPEQVKKMAKELWEWHKWEPNNDIKHHIAEWFKIAADNDLAVVGWW